MLCEEKYMIDHSQSEKMQIESLFFQRKTSVANSNYMINEMEREKVRFCSSIKQFETSICRAIRR